MSWCEVSGMSTVTPLEIASVFGSMMQNIGENNVISAFGDSFALVRGLTGKILPDVAKVAETHVGHSTNAYLSIEYLINNNISVDRIVIFSDMQCYDSRRMWGASKSLPEAFQAYKQRVNPNVTLYSVDLQGYGTLQFPPDEKRVALLAGFSDKLFKFMDFFERDAHTMVKEIENISI